MNDVVVRGIGMTPFGRHLDRNLKSLGREAVEAAVKDAGVEIADIQAVFFANSLAGLITGQECIRGETVVHPLGIGGIPVHNIENACASAGDALHLAWTSIVAGLYDTVLVLGVEKLWLEDRARTFGAYAAAMDVEEPFDSAAGAGSDRTPFVDRQARIASALMDRGVTVRMLAEVSSRALRNGSLNPLAHRRFSATPEEVLASRVVVDPLTSLMSSPVSDGAAAAILSSGRGAGDASRQIRILASRFATRPATEDGPTAIKVSGEAALKQAGLGVEDLDFVEVHDASVAYELMAWTELGLCARGDEPEWIASGRTEIGGKLPINPSGGLIARGHPIGASGLAQVYETVEQLRGEVGARQVEGAQIGLCQIGGGVIKNETATSAVHIFAK
jgi:acetyl-CoA acetyltransferase